jgi:zinc transport system substrate-binding protein
MFKRLYEIFIIILLLSTSTATTAMATGQNQPLIVTSIMPLAAIVKMLTGPHAQVVTVKESGGCPHDYHMIPSDIEKIRHADLIIYIDDNLEHFMPKLLQSRNSQTTPSRLLKLSDDERLNLKKGHNNLHLWLDLEQINIVQEIIKEILAQEYPALSPVLEKNITNARKDLALLATEKKRILSTLKAAPIIASDSIESFFAKSIWADNHVKLYLHEHGSSLKDYKRIEEILSRNRNACIFADTQQLLHLEPLYGKFKRTIIGLDAENWHIHNIDANSFIENYRKLLKQISHCQH